MPAFSASHNTIDSRCLDSSIRRARVPDRTMSLRLFLFFYFLEDGEK